MFQFGPKTTFDLQIAHIILQVGGGSLMLWTDLIGKTVAVATSMTVAIAASVLSLLLYGKYAGQPGQPTK